MMYHEFMIWDRSFVGQNHNTIKSQHFQAAPGKNKNTDFLFESSNRRSKLSNYCHFIVSERGKNECRFNRTHYTKHRFSQTHQNITISHTRIHSCRNTCHINYKQTTILTFAYNKHVRTTLGLCGCDRLIVVFALKFFGEAFLLLLFFIRSVLFNLCTFIRVRLSCDQSIVNWNKFIHGCWILNDWTNAIKIQWDSH